MNPPDARRSWLLVGGLGFLSLALGLLLALGAFAIALVYEGAPTEGGYCSKWGIGWYESRTAEKMVVYIDDGWSGTPPAQHCRVYLVKATGANPPLSGEEALRRDPAPHKLLAAGSHPGTSAYALVIGALLFPPAIWALWALPTLASRARRPATPP